MSGRYDQKKQAGGPQEDGAEVEQEEVQQQQAQEEARDQRQQNQQQNQVGNQAIAAMLAGRGAQLDGGAGTEVEYAGQRHKDEFKVPQHGGDDDGDVPLTIEDLTRSWNPGIRKSQDRARFTERMPDDTLPPPDDAWLASVRAWPDPLPLPQTTCLDAMLQPSEIVVAGSLSGWAREAARWGGADLSARALGHLLVQPAAALQDPDGRVLISRARIGALGSWLLASSPLLRDLRPADSALLGFCLELAGRQRRVVNLRWEVEESEEKLPFAAKLFEQWAPPAGAGVRPRTLEDGPSLALAYPIAVLLDLDDPRALVPPLEPTEVTEEEDDPLGLDAILASFTGGELDPIEPQYRSAIRSAERLATAAARTRIQFAATAVAVAEVSGAWSVGPPVAELDHALQLLDRDVQSVLKLLVEVARAAQKRSVGLKGLRNGLKRASRSLVQVRASAHARVVQVIGGVLPGAPAIAHPEPPAEDPLREAWADGEPALALPWLGTLPQGLELDAAVLWTRLSAGHPPRDLVEPLLATRRAALRAGRVPLAGALGIACGACLLWTDQPARALELAKEQLEAGAARRNGMVVAEAALLAMESHHLRADDDALQRVRGRSGNLLWRMGATGPLSLLARWTPPEDED